MCPLRGLWAFHHCFQSRTRARSDGLGGSLGFLPGGGGGGGGGFGGPCWGPCFIVGGRFGYLGASSAIGGWALVFPAGGFDFCPLPRFLYSVFEVFYSFVEL